LRNVRLVRGAKLSIGNSPVRPLRLKSRAWIWSQHITSLGKLPFKEMFDKSMERMVKGQYFQKKLYDK
jgi:hypothetical protein